VKVESDEAGQDARRHQGKHHLIGSSGDLEFGADASSVDFMSYINHGRRRGPSLELEMSAQCRHGRRHSSIEDRQKSSGERICHTT